jgi:hypothetical protein
LSLPENQVTCNRCGRVHFVVTRAYAEEQVKQYNEFLRTLDDEERKHYPRPPAFVSDYERCDMCGASYLDFRPFREGDCPMGCTLGPIIDRTE